MHKPQFVVLFSVLIREHEGLAQTVELSEEGIIENQLYIYRKNGYEICFVITRLGLFISQIILLNESNRNSYKLENSKF